MFTCAVTPHVRRRSSSAAHFLPRYADFAAFEHTPSSPRRRLSYAIFHVASATLFSMISRHVSPRVTLAYAPDTHVVFRLPRRRRHAATDAMPAPPLAAVSPVERYAAAADADARLKTPRRHTPAPSRRCLFSISASVAPLHSAII